MEENKEGFKVDEVEVDEVLFQKLANRNRAEGLKSMDVSLNIVELNKINDNSIVLRFQYLAKYENVGYLKITGNTVLSGVPANELVEKWQKRETHELFEGILNGLYYFVSPVAITLSTSLGLPPASIPYITQPPEKEKA